MKYEVTSGNRQIELRPQPRPDERLYQNQPHRRQRSTVSVSTTSHTPIIQSSIHHHQNLFVFILAKSQSRRSISSLCPSSVVSSPMQIDSHRRQPSISEFESVKMPPSCPWSSRCGNNGNGTSNTAVDNTLPSPSSSPDVESWQLIRRRNLRMMRKQVRTIVLLMALIEVIRIGPVDIVFAGREGQSARGPEDFGVCSPTYTSRTDILVIPRAVGKTGRLI